MPDWSSRFPSSPGHYWLYGAMHGGKVGLHVIKVRKTQSGGVEACSNGTIVHASDAPGGLFLPIPEPPMPTGARPGVLAESRAS